MTVSISGDCILNDNIIQVNSNLSKLYLFAEGKLVNISRSYKSVFIRRLNLFNTKKRLVVFKLLLGLLVFVSIFASLALYRRVDKSLTAENCELSENRYLCYTTRAHEIAKSSGIRASLDYVNTDVMSNSQYGLVHLVLHVVGEDAYLESSDLNKALAYMPQHTEMNHDNVHMDGYDGFIHGVFRGYFLANKEKKKISSLMKDVCGQYFNSSFSSDNKSPSYANECAHGIGHALMYALDNQVDTSLEACQELPYQDMRAGCYKGVFMENGYLHMPFYESERPKPNVGNDFMVSLCDGLADVLGDECSNYVADAYLAVHRKDVGGAMSNCKFLSSKNRQSNCIHRIGAIYIPGYIGDDFKKMAKVCKESSGEFIGVCLHAVGDGIRLGAAGQRNKNIQFCEYVDTELKEICLKQEVFSESSY